MTTAMVQKIRAVYTAPFYLSMNFSHPNAAAVAEIARLARAAELREIIWMLETSEWRSRRMGAWFALVRPEPEVPAAVLASLRSSDGHLTAPDLAVAAVRLAPAEALSAIVDYQARAAVAGHGSVARTSALIELLGGTVVRDQPTPADRAAVADMLAVADLIQSS